MFKRWLNIITLMAMLLGTFAFAAPTPAAPFPGEIAAPPPPDEKSAPVVQVAPATEAGGTTTNKSKYQFEAVEATPINMNEAVIYIVQLTDAPAASYRGEIAGLEATNPRINGEVKFDTQSDASVAYVSYLEDQQTQFINALEENVARPVKVEYQYQYVLNGMALWLTPQEAADVAKLPGVVNVERDYMLYPTTDVGPEWIGASGIWDGTDTGGLPGTKGEGILVGVLDTGINMDHPSFASTGDDGYTVVNPLGAGNYVGLCDTEPTTYTCTSKLIGVWDYIPEDGIDGDHGSHTASTTAGNVVYSPTIDAPTIVVTATKISGVAPHANIIMYDVCGASGCPNSATTAAKEQAISDGVDVINYSIGGGGANPWTDSGALGWLSVRDAGIFVATSAGNAGPGAGTMGSPGNSPWMLTVGASTHNRKFRNALINISGGTAAPADIEGKSVTSGYGPASIVYAGWYTSTGSANDALCLDPFPTDTFSGEIVVCDRGTIARTAKGDNVLAGGAGGYVLANDSANSLSLNADAHSLPAVHITYSDGVALKAWLAAGTGHMATIAGTTLAENDAYADIVAGFSSRGPNNTSAAASIIKPDVMAPGVDVFAATISGVEYESMSGTSMASPHAAGAGALILALHPTWTPAEVQSALMMTAWTDMLKEDEVTAADPFDRGAGRVDLSKAGLAGLVLDETTTNFEAADPALGGDPQALNLASFGNDLCLQQCSWNRTLENTLEAATTYTAVVAAPAGMTVTVEPATFTVSALGTQVITVTADVSALPTGDWVFAEVGLETDAMHPAFTNVFTESFEGAFPPTGWTVITNTGAGWNTNVYWGYPNLTNGSGQCADANSDASGGGMDTELWSPAIDLSSVTNPQLAYESNFQDYAGSGDAWLDISTDGGTSWTNLTYWTADHGPTKEIVDLSAYAGQTINLRWHYDDNGDWAWFWQIDDVAVREVSDSAYAAPDLHMPLAVVPSTGVLPALVEIKTRRNAGSQLIEDLQALEITDLTIDKYGFTQATLTHESLSKDSANGSPYDNLTDGVFYITTTVGAGAQRLVAEITASEAPDLDMFVGLDLDGDGPEASEEVCASTTGSWTEYCDVTGSDLAAGTWWVLIQSWAGSGSQPDNLTLATAVVAADNSNMTVTGPTAVPQKTDFDLRLYWDTPTMQAGDRWYGAFSIGTDSSHAGNIGAIPVNLTRYADDVTKSVNPASAMAGDIVEYTISIYPDVSGQDLTYFITDTIPAGLTYVPGSASANAGTVTVISNTLTWTGKSLPKREYQASTSLNDPMCSMPLATNGGYVDLELYGFSTDLGIEGDNVAFQATYPGGPFAFFGDSVTNTLYFNDDGCVSLDSSSIVSGTSYTNASIPTAGLPNALMAMLWNDMEIVYEAGAGEHNRGATTGIYLTTGGVPSCKLLEFDDVQKVGDPNSQIDFEMLIAEAIDDAGGEYEIIYAYDNITGSFSSLITGTIGVENYTGSAGTEYAYNDANLQTLQDGMAICFDYVVPDKPVEITYQATVSDTVNLGDTIVNTVLHTTDDLGSKEVGASSTLRIGRYFLYMPLVMKN